jgi:lipopolysaccharide export system protein LptC
MTMTFHTFIFKLYTLIRGIIRALLLPKGYSRFVGMMKIVLPALALSLFLIIFAWPYIAPQNKVFRLAFTKNDLRAVDTLTMLSPRYYGTDDKNHPFTLTAKSSTQLNRNEGLIALETPVANLIASNGGTIVVNADMGFYHQKNGILDLVGHVIIEQDNGYDVQTNSARIDTNQGDAWGEETTMSSGPAGTIEGDGFRMKDHSNHITFTGNTKTHLTLARIKS